MREESHGIHSPACHSRELASSRAGNTSTQFLKLQGEEGGNQSRNSMKIITIQRLLLQRIRLLLLLLPLFLAWCEPGAGQGGSWELLVQNAGISSMHTAVTRFGNAVFLDRTNIGASEIQLPPGVCRDNPGDLSLQHDCTAHSVLFSPANNNAIRPLFVYTDTWCSSGQFFADGTLWQTGGDNDGLNRVRIFTPCADGETCDWQELNDVYLQDGRWYATNQLLPDGTQIVVGGRSVTSLEYVPPNGRGKVYLDLLQRSLDAQTDNMYPYVHLLPNGNLFIFANRDSIVYDWTTDTVVRDLPTLQGDPRNYPSAGSSVLLPLVASNGFWDAQVVVCGGAAYGAFFNPGAQLPADDSCGRITPLATDPEWEMETMPIRRTMGDMILLPTRDVLIINGAVTGSQGWGNAQNPAFTPVLYQPSAAAGSRFSTLADGTIPRLYHSTANLLPDGRILIAGSNPHQYYTFDGQFPTELRVEAFSPDYLDGRNAGSKPYITYAPDEIGYGAGFTVVFTTGSGAAPGWIEVNLMSAPFATHSFSMGQRLLHLAVGDPQPNDGGGFQVAATAPPNANIAPSSYYMLFVVGDGVPSTASWVHIA